MPLTSNKAYLSCYGADFSYAAPTDFNSLYTTDRFFFDAASAGDATIDYAQWTNRKNAPFLEAFINLTTYAWANKQLALILGFDVLYSTVNARVLIYTDAGLLHDQTLMYGDNQILLEIESLDSFVNLYFVHAGGSWFFRGLSGYVV